MIINGDGGYGLLATYIGGPAAQADWLGPKVGGHLAPFLYSSREPNELSQWLCYDESTINIVVVIIIKNFRFPIDFAGHRYNSAAATAQPVIIIIIIIN